jgi:hypothetical protein
MKLARDKNLTAMILSGRYDAALNASLDALYDDFNLIRPSMPGEKVRNARPDRQCKAPRNLRGDD